MADEGHAKMIVLVCCRASARAPRVGDKEGEARARFDSSPFILTQT